MVGGGACGGSLAGRAVRWGFVAAGLVLLAGAPAAAQEADLGFRSWGLRIGATVDPDQVHFGLHLNAGNFAPRVRFQPSFELGLGNDLRVASINLDGLYLFDPKPWRPYLGGGLGVSIIDFDDDRLVERGDDVNVEAGLNLIGGLEWGPSHRYLLEARVGIGDIPEFKLTAGINF